MYLFFILFCYTSFQWFICSCVTFTKIPLSLMITVLIITLKFSQQESTSINFNFSWRLLGRGPLPDTSTAAVAINGSGSFTYWGEQNSKWKITSAAAVETSGFIRRGPLPNSMENNFTDYSIIKKLRHVYQKLILNYHSRTLINTIRHKLMLWCA